MAIHVVAAAYGSKTKGADVTEIVQKRLTDGNDDVIVTNEKLGGDPHPHEKKRFGIVYQLVENGPTLARCATEGETFELIE
jgi:hypothetical protein